MHLFLRRVISFPFCQDYLQSFDENLIPGLFCPGGGQPAQLGSCPLKHPYGQKGKDMAHLQW